MLRRVHDQQSAVGKEVDAHWKRRHAEHYLMAALGIERDHLMGTPVGKPESPVTPTWRLTEQNSVHQHRHRKTDCQQDQLSSILTPGVVEAHRKRGLRSADPRRSVTRARPESCCA